MSKKKISIFTPVYNEEANLSDVYRTVKDVMEPLSDRYEYEHVFSDNGSEDRSREILAELATEDRHVKAILLSKNFGVTKSTLNGLFRCSGDAIIQIDADLQDPPEMIADFIEKWEEGYKVVYGVRKDREEFWLMHMARKLYYRIAKCMSHEKLIPDVGEFRLTDRRIMDEIKKIEDYNPYLRGIIANIGFRQIGIPYSRKDRTKGKTSTNLPMLLDYGINGIISHSAILLRLSTITGVILSTVSFVLIVVYSVLRFLYPDIPAGLTTVFVLVLFFSGIQMIFLGIMGEYIAKIFNQSIKKPLVVEEELLGFDAE